MKQIILFFSTTGLLFACNNADTNKLDDPATSKEERQILVEELKHLREVFASEDREKIAGLFDFPVHGSTVGIYIDDSTFNAQFRENGEKITRAMFMNSFPQIFKSLQINELNHLFKNIPVDSLFYKDTLQAEVHIETEPCYKFYSIELNSDIVRLNTGQGVNRNFKSEDEVPENSSEYCESVLWWVFRFDGRKLKLVEISGAG